MTTAPSIHPQAAPIRRWISVRAIEPQDAAELERFYANLSPDSRHRRFLDCRAGVGADQARAFAEVDHVARGGFVAVVNEPGPSDGRIVGHLCLEPGWPRHLEIAVAVADSVRRQGVGRRLLVAAIEWARSRGIRCLEATTHADNLPMVALARSLGVPMHLGMCEAGVVPVTLDI